MDRAIKQSTGYLAFTISSIVFRLCPGACPRSGPERLAEASAGVDGHGMGRHPGFHSWRCGLRAWQPNRESSGILPRSMASTRYGIRYLDLL